MKLEKLVGIILVATLLVGMVSGCATKSSNEVKKVLTVAVCIRSTSSEYHMQYVEGAKQFIKTLPEGTAELQILACEGDDNKQINDIKALVASKGKDVIVFVDPNNSPNITAIADILETAGVYWTSAWNVPEGVSPMQYKYWVMFQSCDGVKQGYDSAIALFANFKTPNQGTILACQGMLANTANAARYAGLQKALAENPGVKMLDTQTANWDTKQALALTESWLSKYPDVDGIWSANDEMAYGIISALKEKNLVGKVKVNGNDGEKAAIEAVRDGSMVDTIANNGWMQGGYGVAYAYAAYTGKLVVANMSQGQRMFYTNGYFIDSKSIDQYTKDFVTNVPVYDFSNLSFPIARAMS